VLARRSFRRGDQIDAVIGTSRESDDLRRKRAIRDAKAEGFSIRRLRLVTAQASTACMGAPRSIVAFLMRRTQEDLAHTLLATDRRKLRSVASSSKAFTTRSALPRALRPAAPALLSLLGADRRRTERI
jgi:hypothetical protein